MANTKICSRCKHWVRGFEGMKQPERAMSGGCYVDGVHDVMDFEVTLYSDSCDRFSPRLIATEAPHHSAKFLSTYPDSFA